MFSLRCLWNIFSLNSDDTSYCCHFEQSKEECEYLISIAEPHMVKSTVVDSKTGRSKDSRYAFSWFLFHLAVN